MFCKIVEQMFYKVAGLGHRRDAHAEEIKINIRNIILHRHNAKYRSNYNNIRNENIAKLKILIFIVRIVCAA